MYIYLSLTYIGVELNAFTSGFVGLSLNSDACVAEIFRPGIQSIHKGQMEVARSLGMSYFQAMRYVIQKRGSASGIQNGNPPLTNEFVALLKDTFLLTF